MPRDKMPVWEYDPSNRFAFIQKYESISEVQKKYYNRKYPMFRHHPKIHIFPNGNILLTDSLSCLTKRYVIKEIKIINDPFKINSKINSDAVEILNESGEVIAWFYKPYFIDKLKDKISCSVANGSIHKKPIQKTNSTGVYYRKSNKTFINGND